MAQNLPAFDIASTPLPYTLSRPRNPQLLHKMRTMSLLTLSRRPKNSQNMHAIQKTVVDFRPQQDKG